MTTVSREMIALADECKEAFRNDQDLRKKNIALRKASDAFRLAAKPADDDVREATIINSIRALGPPDPSDEEFEQGWAACNEAVISLLTEIGVSLSPKAKP